MGNDSGLQKTKTTTKPETAMNTTKQEEIKQQVLNQVMDVPGQLQQTTDNKSAAKAQTADKPLVKIKAKVELADLKKELDKIVLVVPKATSKSKREEEEELQEFINDINEAYNLLDQEEQVLLAQDRSVERIKRKNFSELSLSDKEKIAKKARNRSALTGIVSDFKAEMAALWQGPGELSEKKLVNRIEKIKNHKLKPYDLVSDDDFVRNLSKNYNDCLAAEELEHGLKMAQDGGYMPKNVDYDDIYRRIAYFKQVREYLDARIEFMQNPYYQFFTDGDIKYSEDQIERMAQRTEDSLLKDYFVSLKKLRGLDFTTRHGRKELDKNALSEGKRKGELARTRLGKRTVRENLTNKALSFSGISSFSAFDNDAGLTQDIYDSAVREFSQIDIEDLHFKNLSDMLINFEQNENYFTRARKMENILCNAVNRDFDISDDQIIKLRAKITAFNKMEQLQYQVQKAFVTEEDIDGSTYGEIVEKAIAAIEDKTRSNGLDMPSFGIDLKKFEKSIRKEFTRQNKEKEKTIKLMYGLTHPVMEGEGRNKMAVPNENISALELSHRMRDFQKNAVLMNKMSNLNNWMAIVMGAKEDSLKMAYLGNNNFVMDSVIEGYMVGKGSEEYKRAIDILTSGDNERIDSFWTEIARECVKENLTDYEADSLGGTTSAMRNLDRKYRFGQMFMRLFKAEPHIKDEALLNEVKVMYQTGLAFGVNVSGMAEHATDPMFTYGVFAKDWFSNNEGRLDEKINEMCNNISAGEIEKFCEVDESGKPYYTSVKWNKMQAKLLSMVAVYLSGRSKYNDDKYNGKRITSRAMRYEQKKKLGIKKSGDPEKERESLNIALENFEKFHGESEELIKKINEKRAKANGANVFRGNFLAHMSVLKGEGEDDITKIEKKLGNISNNSVKDNKDCVVYLEEIFKTLMSFDLNEFKFNTLEDLYKDGNKFRKCNAVTQIAYEFEIYQPLYLKLLKNDEAGCRLNKEQLGEVFARAAFIQNFSMLYDSKLVNFFKSDAFKNSGMTADDVLHMTTGNATDMMEKAAPNDVNAFLSLSSVLELLNNVDLEADFESQIKSERRRKDLKNTTSQQEVLNILTNKSHLLNEENVARFDIKFLGRKDMFNAFDDKFEELKLSTFRREMLTQKNNELSDNMDVAELIFENIRPYIAKRKEVYSSMTIDENSSDEEKMEKMLSVTKDLLAMKVNIDISTDKQFARRAGQLEEISNFARSYRALADKYPEMMDLVYTDQENSKLSGRRMVASRLHKMLLLSDYYRARKLLLTNRYYIFHKKKEIGRNPLLAKNDEQRKVSQLISLVAECAERMRGNEIESRKDSNIDLILTKLEEEQKTQCYYFGVPDLTIGVNKNTEHHISIPEPKWNKETRFNAELSNTINLICENLVGESKYEIKNIAEYIYKASPEDEGYLDSLRSVFEFHMDQVRKLENTYGAYMTQLSNEKFIASLGSEGKEKVRDRLAALRNMTYVLRDAKIRIGTYKYSPIQLLLDNKKITEDEYEYFRTMCEQYYAGAIKKLAGDGSLTGEELERIKDIERNHDFNGVKLKSSTARKLNKENVEKEENRRALRNKAAYSVPDKDIPFSRMSSKDRYTDTWAHAYASLINYHAGKGVVTGQDILNTIAYGETANKYYGDNRNASADPMLAGDTLFRYVPNMGLASVSFDYRRKDAPVDEVRDFIKEKLHKNGPVMVQRNGGYAIIYGFDSSGDAILRAPTMDDPDETYTQDVKELFSDDVNEKLVLYWGEKIKPESETFEKDYPNIKYFEDDTVLIGTSVEGSKEENELQQNGIRIVRSENGRDIKVYVPNILMTEYAAQNHIKNLKVRLTKELLEPPRIDYKRRVSAPEKGIHTPYEKQRENQYCWAYALSGLMNAYAGRNISNIEMIKKKPVPIPSFEESGMTNRKDYDKAVENAEKMYSGEVSGSISIFGDYVFDKLQNTAVRSVVIGRTNRKLDLCKRRFLEILSQKLEKGPVGLLLDGHYVTVWGLDGKNLKVRDSLSADPDELHNYDPYTVDHIFSKVGIEVELVWLEDITGEEEKLAEKFNLKYDAQNREFKEEYGPKNADTFLHRKGIDASTKAEGDVVAETIYIPKKTYKSANEFADWDEVTATSDIFRDYAYFRRDAVKSANSIVFSERHEINRRMKNLDELLRQPIPDDEQAFNAAVEAVKTAYEQLDNAYDNVINSKAFRNSTKNRIEEAKEGREILRKEKSFFVENARFATVHNNPEDLAFTYNKAELLTFEDILKPVIKDEDYKTLEDKSKIFLSKDSKLEVEPDKEVLAEMKGLNGQSITTGVLATDILARAIGAGNLFEKPIHMVTSSKINRKDLEEKEALSESIIIDNSKKSLADIVNIGMREKISFVYSQEAISQLQTIQMIDLICGQVKRDQDSLRASFELRDIDGFKQYVITSVVAVDNTMSFGTASFDEMNRDGELTTNKKIVRNGKLIFGGYDWEVGEKILALDADAFGERLKGLGLDNAHVDAFKDRIRGVKKAIEDAKTSAFMTNIDNDKRRLETLKGVEKTRLQNEIQRKLYMNTLSTLEHTYINPAFLQDMGKEKGSNDLAVYNRDWDQKSLATQKRNEADKKRIDSVLKDMDNDAIKSDKDTLSALNKLLVYYNLNFSGQDIVRRIDNSKAKAPVMDIINEYDHEAYENIKIKNNNPDDEVIEAYFNSEKINNKRERFDKNYGVYKIITSKFQVALNAITKRIADLQAKGNLTDDEKVQLQCLNTHLNRMVEESKGNLKVDTRHGNRPKIVKDSAGFDKKYQMIPANDIPLFPHEPCAMDVCQGPVGDCFFLATISSIADKKPEYIKKMMVDNGNGTVTVRLFDRSGITRTGYQYITVDKTIPFKKSSDGTYKVDGVNGAVLWVQMLEKAMTASGIMAGMGDKKRSYDIREALDGGTTQEAFSCMFGGNITSFKDNSDGSYKNVRKKDKDGNMVYTSSFIAEAKSIRDQIKEAEKAGLPMTCGTYQDLDVVAQGFYTHFGYGYRGMEKRHAYSVMGVETIDGKDFVRLRNPQGGGHVEYIRNDFSGQVSYKPSSAGGSVGTFVVPLYMFCETCRHIECYDGIILG